MGGEMTIRVMFVCLGNICRSPMAEAIFRRMVEEVGLHNEIAVDSTGTSGYHIGETAHPGTRRILARHGIKYDGRARQIQPRDVADPRTYLIAMDQANVDDLQRRFGPHLRVYRLLDFATATPVRDVPDPYYSDNFEYVYRLVEDGCRGLLATIRSNEGL
jgi:protein-tyrosine phosphatase